jgi:hypothetical protein
MRPSAHVHGCSLQPRAHRFAGDSDCFSCRRGCERHAAKIFTVEPVAEAFGVGEAAASGICDAGPDSHDEQLEARPLQGHSGIRLDSIGNVPIHV